MRFDFHQQAAGRLAEERLQRRKRRCESRVQVQAKPPADAHLRRGNGQVALVCVRCGRPLDVNNGHWVAQRPERTPSHVSFRVPQLIMPGLNLSFIWDRWEKAQHKPSKLAKFKCSVLAKPDGGNMQPITDEVLQRVKLTSDYYWHDRWYDTVTGIGIDMGDRAHIAVVAPFGSEGIRCLHFEEIDVDDLVERTRHLEQAFNAGALVVDAMPYKTTAKQVVRSLKRATGYIQYLFQFLVGRLESLLTDGREGIVHLFQFLVGRLERRPLNRL